MTACVDTTFDFHSDSDGRDPDKYSQKLLEYHQLLWNKELPSGARFDLRPEPGAYLVHRSALGVFFLASEAFTTRLRGKAARVIRSIPAENLPGYIGYTAGSTLVFPGNKIGRKMTINGARGFHPRIADRPDLTLECIRRYYLGELPNPLAEPLARYEAFFALFETFRGYVDFFLLQDLLRTTARPSTTSTRSAISPQRTPFRGTRRNTSATYDAATILSAHAIAGSTTGRRK